MVCLIDLYVYDNIWLIESLTISLLFFIVNFKFYNLFGLITQAQLPQ